MNNTVVIENKKILIYAAGAIGRSLSVKLIKAGYNVIGFIDKRSDKLKEVKNLKVYSLREIVKFTNKNDFVIIITLKNVFEHESVASELLKLGYNNLIFKPYQSLQTNKYKENSTEKGISMVYEKVVSEMDFVNFKNEIPIYSKQWQASGNILNDSAIIKGDKDEKNLKIFIPGELLFTPETNNRWSKTNLACTFIMTELYSAFINCDSTFEETMKKYLNEFAIPLANLSGLDYDDTSKEMIINSRAMVYDEMNKRLSMDKDFFVENCTSVKMERNGKFLLSESGKNRVSFLIANHHKYIPVKMSWLDYEAFMNVTSAMKLEQIILKNPSIKIFAPIPHPYFYHMSYLAYNYNEVWLQKVGRIISNWAFKKYHHYNFERVSVLDGLKDNGVSSFFFTMLGCRVERFFYDDEIAEAVDNLFKIETKTYKESVNKLYEIGFISDQLPMEEIIIVCSLVTDKIFAYFRKENRDIIFAKLIDCGFANIFNIFTVVWDSSLYMGIVADKKEGD